MKRYESTPVVQRWDGKRVYLTTRYPIIEPNQDDAIIITNETDYLDTLAYRYYKDPTLWWVIALANNLGKGKMSVPSGLQIRIPANINNILVQFNSINSQ
jgi:phage tail protein X